LDQVKYDKNRDEVLKAANIRTIRIANEEVEENMDRFLEKLHGLLSE
jgi:very-short-patch-repair endonuclease